MADTGTVALITGGAVVLSQALNIVYNLWSQKQKDSFELRKTSIQKKIEIGENCYYFFGEHLEFQKRARGYLQRADMAITPEGRKIYEDFYQTIEKERDKLSIDNLKSSIAEIYFEIESTYEVVAIGNFKTVSLSSHLYDYAHMESHFNGLSNEQMILDYDNIRRAYIKHLDDVINRMERDMKTVKTEIVNLSLMFQ